VESRGFIIASALSYKLSIPFVLARKEGKLPGATIKQSYSLDTVRLLWKFIRMILKPAKMFL